MPETAADVVLAHLRGQVAAFHERAEQVAGHDPEGVHKMRVASRQLRSALQTFHGFLDRGRTDPLRVELKWFAGQLGVARDAEVIRLRLLDAVDRAPHPLMLADIRDRIEADLTGRRHQAEARLDRLMSGPRYAALSAGLDALLDSPPFTDGDRPARDELVKPVRRRWRQLRRAVRAVDESADPDVALHEVRKAAKRLRYAAESVSDVFGEEAVATAASAEQIQGGLGEQQDSIHARSYLLRASSDVAAGSANAFSYGLLYGREEVAATAGVDAAMSAWSELRRHRHRRWFAHG